MKNLLLLVFGLSCAYLGFSQTNYHSNEHVNYKIEEVDGNYVIRYTFKDHQQNRCAITWTVNKRQTDEDIQIFGIPKSMFEPYPDHPRVRARRAEVLRRGLFKKEGNTIMVDKNAMVNTYRGYTKVLADWMVDYLRQYYTDTRMNRIRLAMAFVQDIPYAVPDDIDPNWYYGGVIATPNILTCGYGDCDTKAILFVGILCHLIKPADIRFAGEPGHMYTLIKANPNQFRDLRGLSYYQLPDGKYFVAETAGPGRLDFGKEGDLRYNTATVERVQFVGSR